MIFQSDDEKYDNLPLANELFRLTSIFSLSSKISSSGYLEQLRIKYQRCAYAGFTIHQQRSQ